MLKALIIFQNILFVKDSSTNEEMKSFDKIFQQPTTTYYQDTRSASTLQLKKCDFRTEKYQQFSIINKILSDWNQLKKKFLKKQILKTLNVLNSKLFPLIISSNST